METLNSEEEADISDIEMLAHYKQSGRSSNSEQPMKVSDTRPSAKSNPLSCGKCLYKNKTIDESRLRAHMRDNHHTCDLCDITFAHLLI